MKIVWSILVAVGLWLSYQSGKNVVELECKQKLEDLRTQSEAEKKSSDQKIAGLESIRLNEKIQNDKRIKELDRRYKPALQNSDLDRCVIPADIVGLLSEAASDPRLSEATNP